MHSLDQLRFTPFRPSARLAGLLTALVTLAGCATSHSVTALPDGITVHTFRRDYTNAHVVSRGDAFFMVDAGYQKNAPALAEDLRRAGLDPAKLRAIILTHGHPDHVGGAVYFREQFHTPIVAGANDAPNLAAGAAVDTICPTSDRARDRLAADKAERFTAFTADRTVETVVALDDVAGTNGSITVLPGHTPGSLIVTVPGAAFVGDLLRGAIVGSTAELHFYMCDLDDNRRDVRELLEQIAPGAKVFFPGHFGPVSREAVADRFAGP